MQKWLVYEPQGWWVNALISERTPPFPALRVAQCYSYLVSWKPPLPFQWEVKESQGSQARWCQRSGASRVRRAVPVTSQLSPARRKESFSFKSHYTDPFTPELNRRTMGHSSSIHSPSSQAETLWWLPRVLRAELKVRVGLGEKGLEWPGGDIFIVCAHLNL